MIKMEWKKMKRIVDDFKVTHEFLIHSELEEKFKYEGYYKIL